MSVPYSEFLHRKSQLTREAFGTQNVCHACVGAFGFGQVVRATERVSWTKTSRLEYKEHFGTTDRKGKRSRWGTLCEPCRYHFAAKATDDFVAELKSLGFAVPVISEIVKSSAELM